MKAVLITLSGDPEKGVAVLEGRFPEAEIAFIPRSLLETGSMFERLMGLRRLSPDVFAVMTESLEWQYGQDALMLFGALGGARESLILDPRGSVRSRQRAESLIRSPFHIARNILRGKIALLRARKILTRLESETDRSRSPIGNSLRKSKDTPSITYLRATPAAGTQPGGATSHINGVVKALLGLGASVSFISNDEIAGLDKNSVSFNKIAPDPNVIPRSAFDVSNGSDFAAAVADLIVDERPDLIYQRYCRFSWAGVEASLRANVPLFLEYNGSEVWIGKHWDKTKELQLLERCEKLNLRAATRIFVISDVERDNLLKAGVAEEKIVVNPNGVDTDVFRPGRGGAAERAELGISADTMLVGFLGTFGPWHGVLALADAIALTPKEGNLRFLFVGDGSQRAEVEQKLLDTGDLDRVIFTGAVSHERVPNLLDACDILVSPHVPLADGTAFFGSPTKLFEYMAMGKGIVASRLGQIGDVLTHNKTALLVEPGNVQELSEAMQKLAADPGLLAGLGKAARESAIANHTWRQNALRIAETFENGGF